MSEEGRPKNPDEENALQATAAIPDTDGGVPGTEAPRHGSIPLEELFRQHYDRVFRAAYRVTGNASDAEDALQTVFLRVARRHDELDLSQTAASYLHRAGVRAALDLLRARRRTRAVPLDETESHPPRSTAPDPERGSLSRELRSRLRRGLATVNPKHAEIFALRYFEGYRNRDIAEMLGLSSTAVAVTLHRVRGQLQQDLAPLAGGSDR
jgi:RNA polymerase sigma factor (sigma-70 family)